MLFLTVTFSLSVYYFASVKQNARIARGLKGMTTMNYIILAAIGLMIALRTTLYTIDCSTIYLIISYENVQNGETVSIPSYWTLFRGIIAPIVNITEMCMISYLVYHQDKRNNRLGRKTISIKKVLNKRGGNKGQRKKDEFFMHVEMQDDDVMPFD